MGMPMPDMSQMQMGMQNMGMMGNPMMGMPMMGMPMQMPQQNVNVQPAQFQSLAGGFAPGVASANIDLIMDVPLEVTVELGRVKKSISEVLDFAPGTIVELEKVAGEPVDVLVNNDCGWKLES